MQKQAARRFYTHYHLLTTFIPAYLQGLLTYALLWLQADMGAQAGSEARWMFIGLWVLACLAGSELLERIGFTVFGFERRVVEPDGGQERQLAGLAQPQEEGGQQLRPRLLELGEVPLLAVGGPRPDMLWASTHTLTHTPPEHLRALVVHERAHVGQQDHRRFILAAGLWALSWPVAVLLDYGMLWLLAAAFLHSAVWVHLKYQWQMREEREADTAAAEVMGREEYAAVLARYLGQLEADKRSPLRRARLKGLGLAEDDVQRLIREADDAALGPAGG